MGIEVLTATREELKEIFSINLTDDVKDPKVKSYLVSILDSYVSERGLFNRDELPHSVVINELIENGKIGDLRIRGDTYLFMCGWFPDYFSKKRTYGLGIRFFINKGIDSYSNALSLMSKSNVSEMIPVLDKLSLGFYNYAGAIMHLKSELKGNVEIHPETIFELHDLGLDGYMRNTQVQKTLTDAHLSSKMDVARRMSEKKLYVVH